jgi:hypothetical protein
MDLKEIRCDVLDWTGFIQLQARAKKQALVIW